MRNSSKGFTLIEVVIACAVASTLLVPASLWVRQNQLSMTRLPETLEASKYYRSLDAIVGDLFEADSETFDWALIPPSVSAPIDQIQFNRKEYSNSNYSTPTIHRITYRMVEGVANRYALEREVLDTSTNQSKRSIICGGLLTPTLTAPLATEDAWVRGVIVLRVRYPRPGGAVRTLERRVALAR